MVMTNKLKQFTTKAECIDFLCHTADVPEHLQHSIIRKGIFKHDNTASMSGNGFKLMSMYYEHYPIVFEYKLTTQQKITLGRYVTAPYFYDGDKTVNIFDPKAAFIIAMSGSAERWLKSLAT